MAQTLYCFAADPGGSGGKLLWRVDLPATLGSPTIADPDGDGGVAILLTGADGYVYCLR